ncbi:MAG: hypothetical protein ACKOEC_10585 [Acidimicrobiia bacterium]
MIALAFAHSPLRIPERLDTYRIRRALRRRRRQAAGCGIAGILVPHPMNHAQMEHSVDRVALDQAVLFELSQPVNQSVDGGRLTREQDFCDELGIVLNASSIPAHDRQSRGQIPAVRREVLHALEHGPTDAANRCHLRLQR